MRESVGSGSVLGGLIPDEHPTRLRQIQRKFVTMPKKAAQILPTVEATRY